MSAVYHNPREIAYKFVDSSGQHVDVHHRDQLLVLQHRVIVTSTGSSSGSERDRKVNSLVHEYTVIKEET